MAHGIFVFVPAFGQTISATTFLTTHALQQAFAAKSIGGGVSTLSFPDIAELRSMALTIWYDAMPNVSHLLFIDADMGFSPDVVFDMLLLDEPLVGAVYAQRKLPQSWAGSGTGSPTTMRRGNFMVVEGVGMGCTLIRRDLVKVMLEKMPEIVDTRLHLHPAAETMKQAGAHRLIRAFEKLDLPERGLVSEDLSFCIRWNRCGGLCWASIGHKFSHVGPFDYAGRYLDGIEAQWAADAQKLEMAKETAKQAQLAPPAVPVLTGETVGPAVADFLKQTAYVGRPAPADAGVSVGAAVDVAGLPNGQDHAPVLPPIEFIPRLAGNGAEAKADAPVEIAAE